MPVRAIGQPTVIAAESNKATEDQMVVSVGPYMFQACANALRSHAARSESRASPPHQIRMEVLEKPSSRSSFQVAGVACMAVMASALSRRPSARPSRAVARSTG